MISRNLLGCRLAPDVLLMIPHTQLKHACKTMKEAKLGADDHNLGHVRSQVTALVRYHATVSFG
jgi:hypothetical protein